MYTLYLLLCDKAFFYVGITKSLEKRLLEHTAGYSPHTKRYQSLELVYTEKFRTRAEVEKREKQLKGWSRKKKKALIAGDVQKLQVLNRNKS